MPPAVVTPGSSQPGTGNTRSTPPTAITTAVKARMLENPEVAGTSISVETMKGTVMLSGFAKNANEKATAEALAWKVSGVKSVKNEIAVRP